MELKHLETFRVLAETLNFSQAASRLHFAQSTVTGHIQALENELGVPLFNRMPRRVTLTEHGERLLVYARRLMDLEAEMVSVVAGRSAEPDGTLTIGASETVLAYRLPPLLRAYQDRYPQVRLRLRPFHYSELLDQVRGGNVDVAFIFEQPLRSQSLHMRCLMEEPLLLVAAPGHPLAAQDSVTPLDLEGEPILFTDVSCGYRPMFEHALAAAGMRPNTNLEFHSLEAIKQFVIAGLGVTLIPQVAVQRECDAGELVPLKWSGERFIVWTQMIWSRNVNMCPALQRFIEMSETLLPGLAVRT